MPSKDLEYSSLLSPFSYRQHPNPTPPFLCCSCIATEELPLLLLSSSCVGWWWECDEENEEREEREEAPGSRLKPSRLQL